jgi:hypothetical protein
MNCGECGLKLSVHLTQGTEENNENLRTVDVLGETDMRQLLNRSQTACHLS